MTGIFCNGDDNFFAEKLFLGSRSLQFYFENKNSISRLAQRYNSCFIKLLLNGRGFNLAGGGLRVFCIKSFFNFMQQTYFDKNLCFSLDKFWLKLKAISIAQAISLFRSHFA